MKKREARVQRANALLKRQLEAEKLACEIVGREKHLHSIHQKMIRDDKPLEEIYDLMALRVILSSDGERAIAECYRVFGIVHKLWTPVANRFKDYIAAPKPNGYRSLHTTVLDDENEPLEVQIRSRLMHEEGEYGLAAHWAYKEGIVDSKKIAERQMVERRLQDALLKISSKTVESESIGPIEEESKRVYCFTPKGRVSLSYRKMKVCGE